MTGEMSWIKSNGECSDGCVYETHAAIAKAIRGKLRPFDTYIGPYVQTDKGKLFLGDNYDGSGPYICLWPYGEAPAFRKPVVVYYGHPDDGGPIKAARKALKQV